VVAKRIDGTYLPAERAMLKVKRLRTADCVVGGFRYASGTREVGSLLLGLYDEDGKLDHVGFTATITNAERPALTKTLEALIATPGFSGKAPGGPSRWSTDRSGEWEPLKPKLVVEVRYDHVTGGRNQVASLSSRQGAESMHLRANCAGSPSQRLQASAQVRARSRA
jgi:ATP-dependent DNA ligase